MTDIEKVSAEYIDKSKPEYEGGKFPRYEEYLKRLVKNTIESDAPARIEDAKTWTHGVRSEPSPLDSLLSKSTQETREYHHFKPIADQGPVYARDIEDTINKKMFKAVMPTEYQNIQSTIQDPKYSELPEMAHYAGNYGKKMLGIEPKNIEYDISLKSKDGEQATGIYYPYDDTVALAATGLTDYGTILHELMHKQDIESGNKGVNPERIDVNYNVEGVPLTKLDMLSNALHLGTKLEAEGVPEEFVRVPTGYRAGIYNILKNNRGR
jgi:hypothetical protein